MNQSKCDLVIIGGGPAGLAAAVAAFDAGCTDICILERDEELGGILNQCIHNGFGLHTFKEELTGPEYADKFIREVQKRKIEYKLHTMVLSVGKDKIVRAINRKDGIFEIKAKAIILAMGCRERARGALNIPGFRPAGIYSAGTAQRYVNREGMMPGKEVVILGSGDIGLIMARRMTLEGAKVKLVAELMPYSGGLKRNIVQCLNDYNIPLRLSTTVIDIQGQKRVEAVVIAKVDANNKPIPGTEETITCDTLLFSCGLIPENEISRQMKLQMNSVTGGPIVDDTYVTSIDGVFACGNVLHVHDLVDYVTQEAGLAGEHAAAYIQGEEHCCKSIPILALDGVRYTIPCKLHVDFMRDFPKSGVIDVKFRVGGVFKDRSISVYVNDTRIQQMKKRILTPGEMETVKLVKKQLEKFDSIDRITIRLEETE